jgi:hypothetical protein
VNDFQMTRRAVLAGGAAALLPYLVRPASAEETAACKAAPRMAKIKPTPERAVSLRQLSEALASGKPARLEGLTRLDGYIVDQENRDIVIWGLAERGQPELQVPDLVIALRSAHGKYLVRKDGVDYRVSPLISIDPDTAVWRKLDSINLNAPDGEERQREVCKSPQTVRVEGMPRNTRIASVLVDADYRMKQVGQGSISLPISSPFPAAFRMRVEKWRKEAASGAKNLKGSNTRYWFQPGRFSYQGSADASTVFVDTAQVVLNDEDQYLKGGALVASGETDEVSRAFTCAWTERMEDITKAEPVWRDMHNIFRHFAVARIMQDCDAFSQARFSGEFLLDRYELPSVKVPDTLPGLGRVIKYDVKAKGSTTHWAQSVCGGVSVGFNKPIEKTPDSPEAQAAGDSVLVARPAPTAIAWAVSPDLLRGKFNAPAKPVKDGPTPSPNPERKAPSIGDLFNRG